MKLFCFLSIMMITTSSLFGQAIECLGEVTDESTGEGIPGAAIRIANTQRGTSTNAKGRFRMMLAEGQYCLYVSSLGYRSDSVHVSVPLENGTLNLMLRPAPILGDAFDITAGVDNPADLVIREAMIKKREYTGGLENYSFEAYTKNSFRVKIKKNGRDTILMAGVTETRSETKWIKPDQYYERITARRQTKNFLAVQNIFAVGEWLNFNDDVIRMGKYRIVGPTAPDAFSYYRYQLINTTWLDGKPIYRIRVTPVSQILPLFEGTISIMEGSFAVVEVEGRLTEGVDGMLRDYHIRQQFECIHDSYWLPTRLDTRFIMQLESPGFPPISVETVSFLENYVVNSDAFVVSALQDQLSVDPDADDTSKINYERLLSIPLTDEEELTYHRIDTLMKKPINKIILGVFYAPIRFSVFMRKYGITEFSDLYRFNRVEGNYLGIGWTNERDEPLTAITAKAGYAFGNRRWIGSGRIEQFVSKRRAWSAMAEIYDRISYMEDPFVYSTKSVTYSALVNHIDYRDYYYARGITVAFKNKLSSTLTLQTSLTRERWTSVKKQTEFSLFNRQRSFRDNPKLDHGALSIASFDIKMDTRRFIDGGWYRILSPTQAAWFIQLKGEKSLSHFDSDFNYCRVQLTALRHQPTWSSFYSDMYAQAGWVKGNNIPLQKLFVLESASGSNAYLGSLRTIEPNAYTGRRVWLVWHEHHFGNLLFKWMRLPYLKKSSADVILFHGAGYTFHSKKKSPPFDHDTSKPIHEAGMGLGHMYFRLDWAWRITPRNDTQWVIRWSASLL